MHFRIKIHSISPVPVLPRRRYEKTISSRPGASKCSQASQPVGSSGGRQAGGGRTGHQRDRSAYQSLARSDAIERIHASKGDLRSFHFYLLVFRLRDALSIALVQKKLVTRDRSCLHSKWPVQMHWPFPFIGAAHRNFTTRSHSSLRFKTHRF